MSVRGWTNLHVHSHYSLLEALPKIDELVSAAKADGQEALALTDIGNLYGAIEFYKACSKEGMRPILGAELFVAARTRYDKEHNVDDPRARIVLLAQNADGYHNLVELVSKAHTEGFFHRPRADEELLRAHSDGLVALLPAESGEHALALDEGNDEKAREALERYRAIFGESLFVELPPSSAPGGSERQKRLAELARSAHIPLVAARDVYYLRPEDAIARDLVDAIREGKVLERENVERAEDRSFVGAADAAALFAGYEDAIARAGEVARSCSLELELGKAIFPRFPIPPGSTDNAELRALAERGIPERRLEDTPALRERMDYELGIIEQKGYASYFLIVADLLRHARASGIYTNTRGSAAGSLVSYLCGITTVDPILFNMPFERFLNPERPSAPDIDMDIADNRRDDLINYAREKYGTETVVQIGTFGTMMARAAVRDVARALGHSYGTGDRIAKLIPFGKQGFPVTIQSALDETPELADAYKRDADAREILDLARVIEGNARHVGVHAAGVVIAPGPVTKWIPIQPDPKGGKMITQYDMYSIADEYGGVGLLKFDFLGLKNLSVLADAAGRVRARLGKSVDLDHLPEDKKTYEMLTRGETLGVFQMAGSGMTAYLKELRPTVVHDLNAMVALYRPGPMAFIPDYIKRKANPSLVTYLDPRLESILKPTYGILIYQDDVMMIAVELAGYSWGEADKFRKAMGKKIPEEMKKQKDHFLSGCTERGMKPAAAQKLWDQIETFAAYGFNKCLTADTRIADAETGAIVTVKELVEDERAPEVHALDERRRLSVARASRPFENGVKDVFKLTTRSGRAIRATANHPFLAWDGWRHLDDFRPGERIAVPRRIPAPRTQKPLGAHEAAVLGYLLSEGNLCHPHGIYFYSTQEDELRDFIAAASAFPNARITIGRSKSAASVYVGKQHARSQNALMEWIRSLGLHGKRATEKFVPRTVFSADNASIGIFLGKLWQGDGAASEVNHQLFYATSSRHLAHDVQHLLLRLGIMSTIHEKSFAYRGTRRTGWTVVVTGMESLSAFEKSIGIHMIGRKREAVPRIAASSRRRTNTLGRGTPDTVPSAVLSEIRAAMQSTATGPGALAKRCGVSERLFGYDARKRGYTRTTLLTMAEAMGSGTLRDHAESDIFWDEIVSIEPDGREMTYDLSVPGPENFVANDIVVHNSHAASYGNLAYKTAYMKANFPVDYMAALLTADAGDVEEIGRIVAECKRLGLAVLPPSVNESEGTFTARGDSRIRFGLYSIKNFGTGVADSIITARREGGRFADLADFLARVPDKNLNKKSLESLIESGALDELGERGEMLANMDALLEFRKECHKSPTEQVSLFGAETGRNELRLTSAPPATLEEKLTWEKELLGLYVSGHPLEKHRALLTSRKSSIERLKRELRGVETVVGGFIESMNAIVTKSGEKMAFVQLSDFTDAMEVVVFPRLFKESADIFAPGRCVLLKGKLGNRNGEPSFVAEKAKAL